MNRVKILEIAALIAEKREEFQKGDRDGIAAPTLSALVSALKRGRDGEGWAISLCMYISINEDNFTVGDFSRERTGILRDLEAAIMEGEPDPGSPA
jgi:hypothetical protein